MSGLSILACCYRVWDLGCVYGTPLATSVHVDDENMKAPLNQVEPVTDMGCDAGAMPQMPVRLVQCSRV